MRHLSHSPSTRDCMRIAKMPSEVVCRQAWASLCERKAPEAQLVCTEWRGTLSFVTFALVQVLTSVYAFEGGEGLSVSISGDRYSTFGGWHGSIHYHYPGQTDVKHESQMWWSQVVQEFGSSQEPNRIFWVYYGDLVKRGFTVRFSRQMTISFFLWAEIRKIP